MFYGPPEIDPNGMFLRLCAMNEKVQNPTHKGGGVDIEGHCLPGCRTAIGKPIQRLSDTPNISGGVRNV